MFRIIKRSFLALIALDLLVLAVASTGALVFAMGPPDDKPDRGPNHGEGHTPVTICHVRGPHVPPVEITVDDDSVNYIAHLSHGDTVGACAEPEPVPPDPPTEPPSEPPVEPPTVPPVEPPVDPPGPPDVVPPADPPVGTTDEDDEPELIEPVCDCDPVLEVIEVIVPTKLPNGGSGGLAAQADSERLGL